MAETSTAQSSQSASQRPWWWVPSLYFAEGIPLVLVMTVSTIMYTRMGVSIAQIGFWTSLLGFAWVIKPLWGPLVDLYWTKRKWTILMQVLMGLLLVGVGLTLQMGGNVWWWGSLAALALTAFLSATHDIAADGFYMNALDERRQSLFVGIRSTFYRLAMIFGQGILLILAGVVETKTGPNPVDLQIVAGPGAVQSEMARVAPSNPDGFVRMDPAVLVLDKGSTGSAALTLSEKPATTVALTLTRQTSNFLTRLFPMGPEQQVKLKDVNQERLEFGPESWDTPQTVVFEAEPNMKDVVPVSFRAASGNIPLTWTICFGGVGALMLLLGLYHAVMLPKPPSDGSDRTDKAPFAKAALVILLVAAIPVLVYTGAYTAIAAMVRPWIEGLAEAGKEKKMAPVITFAANLILVAVVWLIFSSRSVRRGAGSAISGAARTSRVPFDEVFASFFRKPGIAWMLAFLLVYRLGEALLVKMAGPFLVLDRAQGGLGLSQAQYGLAYGTVGVLTMTLGGILGGVLASRSGLRKWLLPMCFAINIPDALYIYLAWAQPEEMWKVLLCVAGETFGYGFGFTAYMLYMLFIAGDSEHKTSHFALCTGFMALGMMLPGMVSGAIAEATGWVWFFVIVCIATLPGFLLIPFIPLDREFGRRSGSGAAPKPVD